MNKIKSWKVTFLIFLLTTIAYIVIFTAIFIQVSLVGWDLLVPIELPTQIWAASLLGSFIKYVILGFFTGYSYSQWKKEEEAVGELCFD